MSVDADPRGTGAEQAVDLVHGAAAQVVLLVADRHHVAALGADLAQRRRCSSSVRSPTAPRPSSRRAPGRRTPPMISSSASRPGLVVGEVHDDGDLVAVDGTVKKFIRPGLCSASGRKVRSPSTTAVGAGRRRRGRPDAGRRGRSRRPTVTARPASRLRRLALDAAGGDRRGPQDAAT